MKKLKFTAFLALFFIFLTARAGAVGNDFLIHIEVQESVRFSSDQSTIYFTFPGASAGTTSELVNVQYEISSNNATRTNGLVSVRLDEAFEGILLQAKANNFQKNTGNAHLVPASSDFITIEDAEIGLADKRIDEGEGKLIDGVLSVSYKAVLQQPQPAGRYIRTLIVSFVEN